MIPESVLDRPPLSDGKAVVAAGTGALMLHGLGAFLVATIGATVQPKISPAAALEFMAVDTAEPEAPPEEVEEEAEPEPAEPIARVLAPESVASPLQAEPAEEERPPAPAEAGQVLSASDEVLDFSDTFIVGNAHDYAGGVTSSNGTSKAAVRSSSAQVGGLPGSRGRGKPKSGLAPAKDLSRAPRLSGGAQWDCPFPREADFEQIDSAVVSLRVNVDPSGRIQSVSVDEDPGFGFAREARLCAMRKRWDAGLDALGRPIAAVARVRVRFTRM